MTINGRKQFCSIVGPSVLLLMCISSARAEEKPGPTEKTVKTLVGKLHNSDIETYTRGFASAGLTVKGASAKKILQIAESAWQQIQILNPIDQKKQWDRACELYRSIPKQLIVLLDDSDKFVVAHVLLTKVNRIVDQSSGGVSDGFAVAYNGLLVNIRANFPKTKNEKFSWSMIIRNRKEQHAFIKRYWLIRSKFTLPESASRSAENRSSKARKP